VHTAPITEYLTTGALVPVVYQVNFNTADGLLLAQNFVLRDRDMVYVSNAASVQASKLGGLFESFTRIFRGITPAQY
jgi:polysaccharide export outer membrane protein